MTLPTTWAAGAVLTGLVAAGMPSTATAGTPQPPTADAIAQSADAISKCLTDHGYPPLPSGAVLSPAPAGPSASGPAITVPAAGTITLPVAGTATPAAGVSTPTAGTTTPTAGATPVAGTTSGDGALPAAAGAGALQCGQFVINNYFVTVTTTTTTTNVDAPITAAAGSISTTTGAASPAPPRPSAISAVGRPLRARGSARPGHKQPARGGRVIRVRLPGKARQAKRVVRIRLIRVGYAGRR